MIDWVSSLYIKDWKEKYEKKQQKKASFSNFLSWRGKKFSIRYVAIIFGVMDQKLNYNPSLPIVMGPWPPCSTSSSCEIGIAITIILSVSTIISSSVCRLSAVIFPVTEIKFDLHTILPDMKIIFIPWFTKFLHEFVVKELSTLVNTWYSV